MITITTPPAGQNLQQSFIQQLLDGIAEGQREACRVLWVAIKQLLLENWPSVVACLAIILALAAIKFTLTGRWGFLASVLYNYLYLGLLLVLILIWGPEIFANVWIDLILFVLYAICFKLVGIFVNATGIRNPYGRRIIR